MSDYAGNRGRRGGNSRGSRGGSVRGGNSFNNASSGRGASANGPTRGRGRGGFFRHADEGYQKGISRRGGFKEDGGSVVGHKRALVPTNSDGGPPIKRGGNPNALPLGERTYTAPSETIVSKPAAPAEPKEYKRQFKQKSQKTIKMEREKRNNVVIAPKLKERVGVKMVEDENEVVPYCEHGPCILFEKPFSRDSCNVDTSYSCAVYRNDKCSFTKDLIDWAKEMEDFVAPEFDCESFEYGQATKSYKELKASGKEIFFCETCWKCFNKHACPMIGPINYDLIGNPLDFLTNAIQEDRGEAQYWFKDEVVETLWRGVQKAEVDGLLCIGTPTVFQKLKTRMPCFLLDVDERFKYFFEASEFAQFSMLVNFFYDPNGKEQLINFFKKTKKLLILCDPPFAVFIAALQKSIDKLKAMYLETSSGDMKAVHQMFVLPLFVAKHLHNVEMLDYKVTYSNHREFKNPNKTIVRLFTDLGQENFELPVPYYRHCDDCKRYVVTTNEHCDMCEKCPSKDGSTYKHCFKCERCVKPKYEHCKKCKCCHLPARCIGGKKPPFQLPAVNDDIEGDDD
uniref:CTCHY-type domain-containing protein n=1 Tax=Rhabditophanes sp. KR3021 TaxID=114890 RepID=A0AC35UGD4_9BILA